MIFLDSLFIILYIYQINKKKSKNINLFVKIRTRKLLKIYFMKFI